MINITKEKGYVVITSDDEKTFLIGEGILSVPCNTIEYTLDDESDFIQFNSIYEDGILFVGTIGNIQVNGTLVTRDNIIESLDSVFNNDSDGGGSGGSIEYSAGDGISIADNTITNTGVTAINLGEALSESFQKKGIVKLYSQFYDSGYEVAVNGTSVFGIKPVDDTILLENAGYSANGNFRCGVKVNTDNFKTINGESIIGSGDITIEGGSSGGGITEETDPVFEAWKDGNAIALGGGATASGNRANAIGTESQATSLWANAFGYQAKASQSYSLALGTQAKATAINAIAIGYNTSGATSGAVVIGNAIGVGTVGETSYKTNINNVLKGDTSNYAYVLNEYGNYVRIPTEWTGTQSEYDALGTYYDNITYNIIEG